MQSRGERLYLRILDDFFTGSRATFISISFGWAMNPWWANYILPHIPLPDIVIWSIVTITYMWFWMKIQGLINQADLGRDLYGLPRGPRVDVSPHPERLIQEWNPDPPSFRTPFASLESSLRNWSWFILQGSNAFVMILSSLRWIAGPESSPRLPWTYSVLNTAVSFGWNCILCYCAAGLLFGIYDIVVDWFCYDEPAAKEIEWEKQSDEKKAYQMGLTIM